METTTSAEVTELADEELTTASLSGRLKTSLSLVQTRITGVPALARAQWTGLPRQFDELTDRIATRVRETLDLPSRSDLDELLARVEEMDAVLAQLIDAKTPSTKKTKTGSKAKPAAKTKSTQRKASAGATAKTSRKAKIKQSAAKATRKKS